jgi:hypothetical protein
MMNKLSLPFALALLLLPGRASLHAQARPDCQVMPKSLQAMRNCYRPLLVFSPTGSDPRLTQQVHLLDGAADDMMDRFVLFTPVVAEGRARTPLDAPYTALSPRAMTGIRQEFHIQDGRFVVFLMGEDGTVKLRSDRPVTADRLNTLIDRMPTRRAEMRRPHAN